MSKKLKVISLKKISSTKLSAKIEKGENFYLGPPYRYLLGGYTPPTPPLCETLLKTETKSDKSYFVKKIKTQTKRNEI